MFIFIVSHVFSEPLCIEENNLLILVNLLEVAHLQVYCMLWLFSFIKIQANMFLGKSACLQVLSTSLVLF
jgi:hypothetical protein